LAFDFSVIVKKMVTLPKHRPF